MQILIRDIQHLLLAEESTQPYISGQQMAKLPCIENAFVLMENGKIQLYGPMQQLPDGLQPDQTIQANGRIVMPTFADSHTHIVYAQSRESEFVDRIHGLSYEEIARRGGGILNSAKRLQRASEEELFEQAWARLQEVMGMGTGAIEIKSGYGLTPEDELKMLRVIRRLRDVAPIPVKATFLGAHAIPTEYKERRNDYVNLIVERMIPQVAGEGLADYCDVFCDRGFFTPEETDRILKQGLRYGLKPKIHANELDYSGGIQVGTANGALSVDHLEFTGDSEIEALKNSQTMPTLLPSTAFFLGLEYPPARKMIAAGLPIALASDYNPGSSPSGNMPFVLSLACVKLKMLPEEALHAATVNGAYAMGLERTHGRIRKGAPASIIITKPIPNLAFLPYSFGSGSDLIEQVWIGERRWK